MNAPLASAPSDVRALATTGRSLRSTVTCHASQGADGGAEHEVVLNPDWTVDTPHDLAAERTAVALGGYCDCLTLVETGIPALQAWLELHLRERSPDVWFSADHGWQVDQVPACGCRGRFRWVEQAVDHASSVEHVTHLHGAHSRHTAPLARALTADWQPVVDRAHIDADLSTQTRLPSVARSLWSAGIHPTVARHYANAIPEVRTAIPLSYFLAMAYTRPDLRRSKELARQSDGATAAWLVWSRDCPVPGQPLAYAGWLGLSTINAARARTMLAAGYDSTRADELGAALHLAADEAAALLYDWVDLGCRPTLNDFLSLGPNIAAPTPALLDSALASRAAAGTHVTRTEIALLLAATRSEVLALEAVSDGVRTISEFTRWNNYQGDH